MITQLQNLIIMQSDIILKTATEWKVHSHHKRKKRSKLGLFSLLLFVTITCGIWHWYNSLQVYLSLNPNPKLDHYFFSRTIQLENAHSFEQSILKYKVYLLFTCGYVQPNIILTVCILITFGFTVNSLEVENSTSIAFFQYNGNSLYLQIIRMALDGLQYFLTGRCYCLNSGAAAVWLNLLTKAAFNRGPAYLEKRPFTATAISITYLVSGMMFVHKGRVDLLIGVMVAFVEVYAMRGGSIKYPKQVFQQKQKWADAIKLSKLSVWQPFVWNEYKQNEYMTLDNNQLYIDREKRLELNQLQTHL